jgi:hypothetical protein
MAYVNLTPDELELLDALWRSRPAENGYQELLRERLRTELERQRSRDPMAETEALRWQAGVFEDGCEHVAPCERAAPTTDPSL